MTLQHPPAETDLGAPSAPPPARPAGDEGSAVFRWLSGHDDKHSSAALSDALAEVVVDLGSVLDTLTRQFTQLVGDGCGIRLLSDDGRFLQPPVAFHHRRPEAAAALRDAAQHEQLATAGFEGDVLRSGEAVLVAELDPVVVRAMVPPQYWPLVDEYGPGSAIHAPLRVRGRVLGLLQAVREGASPRYTEADVPHVQELASLAAHAIDAACQVEARERELQRRVDAERALRERDQELRLLIDHVPALLTAVDLQLRVRTISGRALDDLGIRPDTVVGRPLEHLVEGQAAAPAVLSVARAALAGAHADVAVEILGRSWRLSVEPLRVDGRVDGAVAILIDETMQTQARAELERAIDRQKALARAQDEFLSLVSHELRTPLTVVVGLADWLRRTAGDPDAAGDIAPIVDRLTANVEELSRLVEDVTRLSELRTGVPLVGRPVPLRAAVEACTARLQASLARHGVDIDVAADHLAQADPDGLDHVLACLLQNAARFSFPSTIDVSTRRSGDWLVVSVRDRGTGIAPEQRERIFERFSRGMSAAGRGVGAGLAIARGYVEAMGGSIWVEDPCDRGPGTVVAFTVPTAR